MKTIDSVIQIQWSRIRIGQLNRFRDVLSEIIDKEYKHDELVTILRYAPKYIAVEAMLWGFDTPACDQLFTHFSSNTYRGLLEDPNKYAISSPKKG